MTSFTHLLDAETRRFWARRLVRVLLMLAVVTPTIVVAVLTARSRVGHRIDLVGGLGDAINGSGVALLLCAVIIGSSFLGAEVGAASLSTQLLYEPRRTRVWIAKALAVGLGSAIFTAVVLAVLSLELWGGAAWRGLVEGADTRWVPTLVADALRASGAAALAGMFAFGVTGITHRTVGAVAGFLAFGMILEPVLVSVLNVFDGRVPVGALVILAGNMEAGDEGAEGFTSLLHAGSVAAAWTAAFLVLGGALFARREVR